MEKSWADRRRGESPVESPSWHSDVLRERAEATKSGKEVFLDWDEVKKQLRASKKRGK